MQSTPAESTAGKLYDGKRVRHIDMVEIAADECISSLNLF